MIAYAVNSATAGNAVSEDELLNQENDQIYFNIFCKGDIAF